MSGEIIRSLTPEERELQRKQAELEVLELKLAQRELDLVTFQAELASFQGHYLSIVGRLYAELDELEAQIAEAKARQKPNDSKIQDKAKQARTRAEQTAHSAESAAPEKSEIKPKFPERLKKLYREIAKRFHPDLAADEAERVHNQQLMAEANQAYQTGDMQQLQAILQRGHNSPEAVKGLGAAAELIRIIRRIARAEERLKAINLELNELKKSSLYQFRLKVNEAKQNGLDLLAEMAGYLRREVAKARVNLANLTWKKANSRSTLNSI